MLLLILTTNKTVYKVKDASILIFMAQIYLFFLKFGLSIQLLTYDLCFVFTEKQTDCILVYYVSFVLQTKK